MRKFLPSLVVLAVALASAAPAAGPKFSTSGGIGSADSTFSGGEPVGGTYSINGTTGRVSAPIVNLRPGSAPASPQNGDCWTTVAGLFCRINDVTVGPYGASSGSVTQVGLVTPSIFTAGGAVTSSGNLSFTLNSQSANQVFAAPNGSSGTPGFRALVGADIPAINMAASGNGGVTGALGLVNGGLGATTAAGGRSTLGLGTAATQNTGTSGAVVPLLNGANIWSAAQTYSGSITVGTSVQSGDALELGQNRASDGTPFIDFHAAAGTDYEARIIRDSGTNGGLNVSNLGTGDVTIAGGGAINLSAPSGILSGTTITAPFFKPSTPECANILHYGADRTGAAFSDAAWTSALAATQPGKQCVYLPAGEYKFSSAKSVSIAASYTRGSVTIKGDGSELTLLNFANNTTGVTIALNTQFQSFHVQDISILAGGWSTTTSGLVVTQNATPISLPAIAAPSDITRVVVRGSDGYSNEFGFYNAVSLAGVSNVSLFGGYLSGPGDVTAKPGICLSLSGTTDANAVVFNVIGTTINSCGSGILYGSSAEGLTVTASNLVANGRGIYVPPGSTDGVMIAVTNSHFNNYNSSIDLQVDPGGVTIADNYFIVNTGLGNANGININATQDYAITGNAFARQRPEGVATGIVIGNYNTHSGIIQGNTFQNMNTAINLAAGSQRATVGINSFAPSVTTKVTNSGTNNIVAATCTAAPTSGFRVTNGVVVSC